MRCHQHATKEKPAILQSHKQSSPAQCKSYPARTSYPLGPARRPPDAKEKLPQGPAPHQAGTAQRKEFSPETIYQQQTVQRKPNDTGLPDKLKEGIENMSGFSMDDVRVRYNSGGPAQLQALAFTKGTEVHIGPGQEKHLPHEAWHVVQQKQGRVWPTMQMKGNVPVNDDKELEKEADNMGEKIKFFNGNSISKKSHQRITTDKITQLKLIVKPGKEVAKKDDDTEEVAKLKNSDKKYLLASDRDLTDLENGAYEELQILTPYIHVIGENHLKSHFHSAAARWDWGASKMIETFDHHPDFKTDKVQKRLFEGELTSSSNIAESETDIRKDNISGKNALPLENTVAKHLAAINIVKYCINVLDQHFENPTKPVLVKIFKLLKNWVSNLNGAKNGLVEYINIIKKQPNKEARGYKELEQLKSIKDKTTLFTRIAEDANNEVRFSGDSNTRQIRYVQKRDISALRIIVDLMLDASLKILHHDLSNEGLDVSATRPAFETSTHHGADPMREFYMKKNIETLTPPSLVRIGAGHLKALKALGLNEDVVKLYEDYFEFSAAIDAAHVFQSE